MSRPIKFRVYDKVEGHYWDGVTLDLQQFADEPKRFILEEFTGRHDQNGKKIFEGDIVLVHFPNVPYVVKFGEYLVDGLDYYSNHTTAGFYLESPHREAGDTSNIPALCKVVGNIHENPELLK